MRRGACVCSSKEDAYPAKYAVEGKKLKKHDPAEDEFAKLSEDNRTTYQIIWNSSYGLVGVSPDARGSA